MIPATIYKHTRLTASQRAEDRACPDGVEEVHQCDCGEPATVKCGAERFCVKCNDEIDADAAERAAAMAKEGAD